MYVYNIKIVVGMSTYIPNQVAIKKKVVKNSTQICHASSYSVICCLLGISMMTILHLWELVVDSTVEHPTSNAIP